MNLSSIFDFDQQYAIKWGKETGYAIIVAVATVIAQTVAATDIGEVTDWKAWGVALGAAVARVVWATVTNRIGGGE